MPRRTRKPHERKKANRKQQARDREVAELERKFHAEWQAQQDAIEDIGKEPTQPEIGTTDHNGGDDQP
jgi:hypothetical protein